jgi:hypothetical protein
MFPEAFIGSYRMRILQCSKTNCISIGISITLCVCGGGGGVFCYSMLVFLFADISTLSITIYNCCKRDLYKVCMLSVFPVSLVMVSVMTEPSIFKGIINNACGV